MKSNVRNTEEWVKESEIMGKMRLMHVIKNYHSLSNYLLKNYYFRALNKIA